MMSENFNLAPSSSSIASLLEDVTLGLITYLTNSRVLTPSGSDYVLASFFYCGASPTVAVYRSYQGLLTRVLFILSLLLVSVLLKEEPRICDSTCESPEP